MPVLTATAAVNDAVSAAKSLPNLIANLYALDPALATQLETKPLLASKTPWGTLAAGMVGWVSSRYGFGFDANTCSLVSGFAVLVGSYAMRALTRQPIAGLLNTPATASSTSMPATAP
jgi:hypothetical protein